MKVLIIETDQIPVEKARGTHLDVISIEEINSKIVIKYRESEESINTREYDLEALVLFHVDIIRK